MSKNGVWLVVIDDYSYYQPTIFAFKAYDEAMEYLESYVRTRFNEELTIEDRDNESYKYDNGTIYVTKTEYPKDV